MGVSPPSYWAGSGGVVDQPVFGLFTDLAERVADVNVQDATPVAAVEAFFF